MTVQDVDGFYNIYINSRLCIHHQQQAIQHELKHINRNDFESLEQLEIIEAM